MLSKRFVSSFAAALLAVSASAQVTIGAGTAVFVDISVTGTPITTTAGDDTAHGFVSTVGNALFPAGPVVVTSNGFIVAGATPLGSTFTNAAIISTSTGTLVGYGATNQVICPWWDDLYAVGSPGGTLYQQVINGMLIIQYQNIGHFATSSAGGGPAITFQVQIGGGGCTPSFINMIYPDATFGGAQAANDNGASATVGYIGGTAATNAQYSFNTPLSIPDGTSLTITDPTAPPSFGDLWTTGPGSVQYNVCNGSPGGNYQLIATLNAGLFPNGWLYGLDITYAELLSELGIPPFFGPLDGTGAAQIGPVGGLPSGLTVYAFTFNIPPASVPNLRTASQQITIP
jgi:hypothetical protein